MLSVCNLCISYHCLCVLFIELNYCFFFAVTNLVGINDTHASAHEDKQEDKKTNWRTLVFSTLGVLNVVVLGGLSLLWVLDHRSEKKDNRLIKELLTVFKSRTRLSSISGKTDSWIDMFIE